MAVEFDNIIDFIAEHIDTWLSTFAKVNKQNTQLIINVQEETREIEKEIYI